MIVRGPFNLQWGPNVLSDVTEISIDYDISTDDYTNNSGNVFEIEKGIKVSATITLLSTDIASLAAVLPQNLVANGGILSDGKVVTNSDGAIEIMPGVCNESEVKYDLKIVSCHGDREVMIIPATRTRLDGVDIDKVRKIRVKFMGEGTSVIQLFKEELLMLDDGNLSLLDNEEALIL